MSNPFVVHLRFRTRPRSTVDPCDPIYMTINAKEPNPYD